MKSGPGSGTTRSVADSSLYPVDRSTGWLVVVGTPGPQVMSLYPEAPQDPWPAPPAPGSIDQFPAPEE